MRNRLLITSIALALSSACSNAQEEKWVSIFNGENLDGWTVKFSGYELGENHKNTFRADDGILSANYDEYEGFDNEWGHIFYKEKLSYYRIRLEYRFTGDTIPGAPEWAIRNNGVLPPNGQYATMALCSILNLLKAWKLIMAGPYPSNFSSLEA